VYINPEAYNEIPKIAQISSAAMLDRAGGYTEKQKQEAEAMIERISKDHKEFKISVEDVLVMHIAHNLSFEHIESTLRGMIITA